MEGVKVFSQKDFDAGGDTLLLADRNDKVFFVQEDLKRGLEGMTKALFGNVQMRWVDAYFPFTDPSFELEIYFGDEWLEVLGCGVIQQEIIINSGRDGSSQLGWAFGLGLERLAMILFGIPDIRLFWTNDPRFHKQFENNGGNHIGVTFTPYSKYPPCYKDISFWTSGKHFHPNDLHELVRNVAGDLVEKVELIDSFVHPTTERLSNCFRISYRSMDRSLTNEEVDELQNQVRSLAVQQLELELR
jgi:phenylalanyl-tRNA synthetase alpha chain